MTKSHTENHGNTEKPAGADQDTKVPSEAEKGSSQHGGTSTDQAGNVADKR